MLESVEKDSLPTEGRLEQRGLEQALLFGGDGEGGCHYVDELEKVLFQVFEVLCVRAHVRVHMCVSR